MTQQVGSASSPQVGSASSQVRVLIVDDRPGSRDGLRALLSTWSEIQIVGEATDGQEAVVMAEKYDPDVVLMDARMPTMDGLEATRLINHRCPNVNVIILTLYSAYHTNAMNAGAVAFLVKGCPSEELLKTIKTWGAPPAPACSALTPSTPAH